MSTLDIFRYEGQQVRTVIIDGEPWFIASDVARVLDLGNVRSSLALLDDDEKGVHSVDTLGGIQSVTTINEPGLYSLILRSRKPEAKAFKRWVTHEVLPTIRRTGQFGSQLPGTFAEALELAATKVRALEAAEAKIALDAPKVEAFDRWMDSDGYYPMDAVAKILQTGRNTLYVMLREAGVIMAGSTRPYQRYAHHFAIIAGTTFDGHAYQTTKVRPTGVPFIAKKLGIVIEEAVA
jgi:prophage antirepressor-like protein